MEERNTILVNKTCCLWANRRAFQNVWGYSVGVGAIQTKAQGFTSINSICKDIVFVTRPPRYNYVYIEYTRIVCVQVISPFPNNSNPTEDFDPTRDMDIISQGLSLSLSCYFTALLECVTLARLRQSANKRCHMELKQARSHGAKASLSINISFTPDSVTQHNEGPTWPISRTNSV